MAKKPMMISMESLSEQQGNDIVFLDGQQQNWDFELINQSDAEDSDTDSLISLENGFGYISWNFKHESQNLDLDDHQPQERLMIDDVGEDLDQPEVRRPVIDVEERLIIDVVDEHDHGDDGGDGDGYGDHVRDDGCDDDDGYGYGYGLDDELVPWNVSGKLGRQRMRKLGKRVFTRMGNSKKNQYLHVKPGAVYGKHGLGMKA